MKQIRVQLTEFIALNRGTIADKTLIWASVKGCIRNVAVQFSSNLHRQRLQKISDLEKECRNLERDAKKDYNIAKANTLKSKQAELNDLLRYRVEYMMQVTRSKYYSECSKPSHLLALTLKQQETKRAIPAIRCSQRGVLTSTEDINKTFKEYFKKLYTSDGVPLENDLDTFFAGLNLPTLTAEETENLDKPITLEELLKAVKGTKKGRTPGIDGIPVELYLQLWDLLGPIWLEAIHYASNIGSFHRDLNTALITVIPKPGKDHLECANYRPISLINADLKIFSKVLANRMEQVIGKIINSDQTGFLKGRFPSDNIRRLLHILSSAHKIPPACGLLFLDAEKAFDRLEWTYLWRVLKEFKFGEKFISMIQTLYSNPSARVCVGGGFSELFQIGRGSRQGDPLSPLVFNLSIEPLAQLIRNCPQVSPITIGTSSHSVSLYADDTLIYMADVQNSLPIVLEKLKHFGYLSGYKVNYAKSALMLINVDKHDVALPPEVIVVTETTYLGIRVRPNVTLTAKNSYLSVLKKIEEDISRWTHLPASVPARISVIKMNILPRINFVSSMIPLSPPAGYWQKLDTLLRKYIWNGKRPAIKWSVLQMKRNNGGCGCPNFKLYHWAFVLRSMTYWLNDSKKSAWKSIESNLIEPLRLRDFLFLGLPTKKCNLQYGPILSYMLVVFRSVERYLKCKPNWYKSSPLWNNRHFISGGKPFINKGWSNKGIKVLQDINGEESILSFQDLVSKYDIDKHSLFSYFRIRSACKAYGVPWGSELRDHPISKMLLDAPKRVVSYIYDQLLNQNVVTSVGMKAWEEDISTDIFNPDWELIWRNVERASKNSNHCYIHLKYCHRAYLTPVVRHRMGAAPDPYCSFCPPGTVGSFIHVVWECPGVQELWGKVVNCLSALTGTTPPMDPAVHLLDNDSQISLQGGTRKIWLAGLTATKKVIAQRWKSNDVSFNHWLHCFLDIAYMELSSARIHNATRNTTLLWTQLKKDIKKVLSK